MQPIAKNQKKPLEITSEVFNFSLREIRNPPSIQIQKQIIRTISIALRNKDPEKSNIEEVMITR